MCSFKLLQGGDLKNMFLGVSQMYYDGCRNENLCLSSLVFCIRNNEGDLVYAEIQKIGEVSAIAAEIRAVKQGLEDCVQKGCLALTIETDSLITKEILDWGWEVPWIVSIDGQLKVFNA